MTFYLEPSTQFGQLVGAKWNEVKKMKRKVVGLIDVEKLTQVNAYSEDSSDFWIYPPHSVVRVDTWRQDRYWLMWKRLDRRGKAWAEANAYQYAIQVSGERAEDVVLFIELLREREDYLFRRCIWNKTKKGDVRGRLNRQNRRNEETGYHGPRVDQTEDRTDIVHSDVEQGSPQPESKPKPPRPETEPPMPCLADQSKATFRHLPDAEKVNHWASLEAEDDEKEETDSAGATSGSTDSVGSDNTSEAGEVIVIGGDKPQNNARNPKTRQALDAGGYYGPPADISWHEGHASTVHGASGNNAGCGLSATSPSFTPLISLASKPIVSTTAHCGVDFAQQVPCQTTYYQVSQYQAGQYQPAQYQPQYASQYGYCAPVPWTPQPHPATYGYQGNPSNWTSQKVMYSY